MISIEHDDSLVLYTDGVTDAWDSIHESEYYGEKRLMAAIAAAPRKADELLAAIEADLNEYVQGASEQDDITFLVLTKD